MNCNARNRRSTRAGRLRTQSQVTSQTRTSAIRKPKAGETTMPAAVLLTPSHTIALNPALARPAPTRPPTRACEDEEGMPASQVTTFQTIAPPSAPKISRSVTTCTETMPAPTVCATCRPKNRKAMKLKKAAQNTAWIGLSTRVETMVAIELAASCMPFRKSNSRATPISSQRMSGVKSVRPRGQRCSMRMPLTPFETSSKRSMTFSRWSNTSAPAMNAIGRSWQAAYSAFMPAS